MVNTIILLYYFWIVMALLIFAISIKVIWEATKLLKMLKTEQKRLNELEAKLWI